MKEYKTDLLSLFNMDCMDLMKQYPDKHFSLALVDPPYGIGADKAQNNSALQRIKANGESKAGRGWKLYKETEWDNSAPNEEYFKELFRVSKRQIIWGGNYFSCLWSISNSFVLWNKMQRDFSLADGELAWYSETNKAMRIFDMARGSALADSNETGGRMHPCQKPVALYRWLLSNYAKEGDNILDTHGGSMSIAIACHYAGYHLTASELDADYFQASIERVKRETAQMTLGV